QRVGATSARVAIGRRAPDDGAADRYVRGNRRPRSVVPRVVSGPPGLFNSDRAGRSIPRRPTLDGVWWLVTADSFPSGWAVVRTGCPRVSPASGDRRRGSLRADLVLHPRSPPGVVSGDGSCTSVGSSGVHRDAGAL